MAFSASSARLLMQARAAAQPGGNSGPASPPANQGTAPRGALWQRSMYCVRAWSRPILPERARATAVATGGVTAHPSAVRPPLPRFLSAADFRASSLFQKAAALRKPTLAHGTESNEEQAADDHFTSEMLNDYEPSEWWDSGSSDESLDLGPHQITGSACTKKSARKKIPKQFGNPKFSKSNLWKAAATSARSKQETQGSEAAPIHRASLKRVSVALVGGKAKRVCARSTKANLDDTAGDKEALENLEGAKLAKGSRSGAASRFGWWRKRCGARGLRPLPLTVASLELAAALLRKGGYRSGHLYLSAIKKAHTLAGHKWTEQHVQALADANRAIKRGLGPSQQAQPLPIRALTRAEAAAPLLEAAKVYWPTAGVHAMVVSSAWLLREIESSTAAYCSVVVHPSSEENVCSCGWVEWHLPSSKTDAMALGKTRTLACACPSTCCPVKSMRHVKRASLRAARDALGTDPPADWPLLVKGDGKPLSKEQVVRFYRDAVRAIGEDCTGITGHSARVSGAQRMAEAGIEITLIQLFGRWGSAVVLRYVREAALGKRGGTLAMRIEQGLTNLEEQVTKKVTQALPKQSDGVIAALRDRELEAIASRLLPKLLERRTAEESRSDWASVADSIKAELHEGFDVLTGATQAGFVQCYKGRAHVTLDRSYTLCGWIWSSSNSQAILKHQWDSMGKGLKCKTCIRRC